MPVWTQLRTVRYLFTRSFCPDARKPCFFFRSTLTDHVLRSWHPPKTSFYRMNLFKKFLRAKYLKEIVFCNLFRLRWWQTDLGVKKSFFGTDWSQNGLKISFFEKDPTSERQDMHNCLCCGYLKIRKTLLNKAPWTRSCEACCSAILVFLTCTC